MLVAVCLTVVTDILSILCVLYSEIDCTLFCWLLHEMDLWFVTDTGSVQEVIQGSIMSAWRMPGRP